MLIGFSIINQPAIGVPPIYGNLPSASNTTNIGSEASNISIVRPFLIFEICSELLIINPIVTTSMTIQWPLLLVVVTKLMMLPNILLPIMVTNEKLNLCYYLTYTYIIIYIYVYRVSYQSWKPCDTNHLLISILLKLHFKTSKRRAKHGESAPCLGPPASTSLWVKAILVEKWMFRSWDLYIWGIPISGNAHIIIYIYPWRIHVC